MEIKGGKNDILDDAIFTRDNTSDSPKDCYKCLLKIILLILNEILLFRIEVRVSDANQNK